MTFFSLWLVSLVICLLTMTLAWVIYLLIKNPAVVDVFWGLGIVLVAGYFYFFSDQTGLIIFLAIFFWGGRLCFFLLKTRIFSGHQDSRYQEMKERWKTQVKFKFLLTYWFQALLQSFFAFSYLFFDMTIVWNFLSYGLLILAFLVVLEEGRIDYRSYQFKKDIRNKNLIYQEGWWRYSRHPNYFFEFLFWFFLSLIIAISGVTNGRWEYLLALLTPAVVYGIFNGLTIKISEEQSLRTRGEAYQIYQKTTSRFFPMPFKSTKKAK